MCQPHSRRNCSVLGCGAALLASGVIGNLTDRLLHGYVVDFLDVILPWYRHWPAFNIAESSISIAPFLFPVPGCTSPKPKKN